MTRVLVTGASGFVGSAVCPRLERAGATVRKALRSSAGECRSHMETVVVGEIHETTAWREALAGVHTVVHLAARVHLIRDTAAEPLEQYRMVNVRGTERLAREAAAAGVKRLVFVSSVKVHGEATGADGAFREGDAPRPVDPYGVSKWEAEEVLFRVARETGLEVVVLRPPLVYGPGVKANFFRLMEWVARGLPLPLGSIRNRRSLIFVENLADAIATVADHPAAAGETFLVSDGPAVSSADLSRAMAAALGRRARLVPIPSAALLLAGKLLGRSGAVERLCGSLVIDSGRITRIVGWTPPYSMYDGLKETADWLLNRRTPFVDP